MHVPYRIVVQITLNQDINLCILGIGFNTFDNVKLRTIWSKPTDLKKGKYNFTFIEDKIFYTGTYQLCFGISMIDGKIPIQFLRNAITIEFEKYVDSRIAVDTKSGLIINQEKINIKKI